MAVLVFVAIITPVALAGGSFAPFERECAKVKPSSAWHLRAVCNLLQRVSVVESTTAETSTVANTANAKADELQATVENLQSQINNLAAKSSGVNAYDVDNNKLGLFLGTIPGSEGYTASLRIFIPPVNRWIGVRSDNGKYSNYDWDPERNTVFFSEPNCIGQAYMTTFTSVEIDRLVNTSAVDGSQPENDRFFKVDDPKVNPDPFLIKSQLYNAACKNDGGDGIYHHAVPASEIQLPFTLPIKTPILLRAD